MEKKKWPFWHIREQSHWPLHPVLVPLAVGILIVPEKHRRAAVDKTVERCVRLGAKLAVEFNMPPCRFLDIAEQQIVKEGGAEAASHLDAHREMPIDPDANIEGKDVLADFLTELGVPVADPDADIN